MPEDNSIVVLSPGREALPEEIHKNALPFVKLMAAHGWEHKVGNNRFEQYGEAYKSGPNAGERHGDDVIDNTYVEGVKNNHRIMCNWWSGAFNLGIYDKRYAINLEQARAVVAGQFEMSAEWRKDWAEFKAQKKIESDRLKAEKEEKKNGIKV